jgi:hypothetical protein
MQAAPIGAEGPLSAAVKQKIKQKVPPPLSFIEQLAITNRSHP